MSCEMSCENLCYEFETVSVPVGESNKIDIQKNCSCVINLVSSVFQWYIAGFLRHNLQAKVRLYFPCPLIYPCNLPFLVAVHPRQFSCLIKLGVALQVVYFLLPVKAVWPLSPQIPHTNECLCDFGIQTSEHILQTCPTTQTSQRRSGPRERN